MTPGVGSRLILLNGPPACGKSTLARRYVDEHPLALDLDVDRVRDLIGCWRDEPDASGLLARAVALAAARVHLTSGHDVIVPQFLARTTFIEQLEQLAREVGAAFLEVVLLDSKANMVRRYAERGGLTDTPDHLSVMYDRFTAMLATRPAARIIRVVDGGIDLTYQAFLRQLA